MANRLKHGTKYPKITELPENASLLSAYKDKIGLKNAASVCVKYDRYLAGTGSYPGYKIVNWQGFNFVIPD
mgnify:CR=1 FL=1